MRKKYAGTRFALTLIAVAVLLPMILTVIYSFSSPDEIKSYMATRGSYDDTQWMDIKLSPDSFSLTQFYRILIEDETEEEEAEDSEAVEDTDTAQEAEEAEESEELVDPEVESDTVEEIEEEDASEGPEAEQEAAPEETEESALPDEETEPEAVDKQEKGDEG